MSELQVVEFFVMEPTHPDLSSQIDTDAYIFLDILL